MTEKEFLEHYDALYRNILNEYIKLTEENSNLQYQSLHAKTIEYDVEISQKANSLISQLIKKNGLGGKDERETELMSSDLYRKAFNIILECNQYYQSIIDSILLEVQRRDLGEL